MASLRRIYLGALFLLIGSWTSGQRVSWREVGVSSSRGLRKALASLRPATRITLHPGKYVGPFQVNNTRGRDKDQAVVIVGSDRERVKLSYKHGPCLLIRFSRHIRLSNLTCEESQKGVIISHSEQITVELVNFRWIKQVGTIIHWGSNGNNISRCSFENCGMSETVRAPALQICEPPNQ